MELEKLQKELAVWQERHKQFAYDATQSTYQAFRVGKLKCQNNIERIRKEIAILELKKQNTIF